jgi:rhodanese-related sulfurtransferase
LSRKRLNCEINSPNKKHHLSNNLFKIQFNVTPLVSQNKKWLSSTYNSMTSSPKKMDLVLSPLKSIDNNIYSSINNTIENSLVSNLNMIIQKPDQSSNLMGNYSSNYALPHISGRHKDLKTISPETLAKLINGEYNRVINCFTVIDSRYPYEYEAGHIDGSKNIYHEEDVNKYFFGTEKPTLKTDKKLINNTIEKNLKQSSSNSIKRIKQNKKSEQLNLIKNNLSIIKESENDENSLQKIGSNELANDATQSSIKRHAIIFHCEFSSERAPKMY